MADWKARYGYDPFGSRMQSGLFIFLMSLSVTALPMAAVLFAGGNPWAVVALAVGSLAFCGVIRMDKLEDTVRCYLYRAPRKYARVVKSAYYSGWRQNLIESPKAAVFAKSLVEDDYANYQKSHSHPRVLANGRTYWGFFHDSDERIENPFYTAWLAARVLDEKSETWDSMPRLLSISSTVRNYVRDRGFTGATTVTSLTMAWFYSEMSDDDAEAILANHAPELARLLLEGMPMEYALEML